MRVKFPWIPNSQHPNAASTCACIDRPRMKFKPIDVKEMRLTLRAIRWNDDRQSYRFQLLPSEKGRSPLFRFEMRAECVSKKLRTILALQHASLFAKLSLISIARIEQDGSSHRRSQPALLPRQAGRPRSIAHPQLADGFGRIVAHRAVRQIEL